MEKKKKKWSKLRIAFVTVAGITFLLMDILVVVVIRMFLKAAWAFL